MSDRQRSAVYSVEDQWSAALDRGGSMDFLGSHIVVPEQRRFIALDDVRVYVADVCTRHGWTIPEVRHRMGGARAHYEAEGVLAIPEGEAWAMRECVVLHELAHHGSSAMDHGSRFTATMLMLVESELGPEAALVLRTGYLAAGVDVIH